MVLYPAIAKHQSKEAAERLLAETYAVQQVLADLDATSDPADKRVAELVHKTIQVRHAAVACIMLAGSQATECVM
jgi:hypothetical protein